MNKKTLVTIISLFLIIIAAAVAVVLTKGYTFSPTEVKVLGTGIISVTSIPDGASVYIDGHLTTATNATVPQLSPKVYDVKIVKDGYIPWEKKIDVNEGLVSEIKATLFPALPTFYPLTTNGAVNPSLSPDGQKLAFAVPLTPDSGGVRQKGGVWVWTMSSQPIAFARSAEPHQVVMSDTSLDFSKGTFKWSPDSKQLLISVQAGGQVGDLAARNYLVSADTFNSNDSLQDITPQVQSIIQSWNGDQKAKNDAQISAIKNRQAFLVASGSAVLSVASDSASLADVPSHRVLIWSPDDTKFMIIHSSVQKNITKTFAISKQSGEQVSAQVYDFGTTDGKSTGPVNGYKTYKLYNLPPARKYMWLPDSMHIILVDTNKISICEPDGSNISTVYAGTFEEGQVFPWPDSSRLVMLTSFNTPTASTPNLFGINLK